MTQSGVPSRLTFFIINLKHTEMRKSQGSILSGLTFHFWTSRRLYCIGIHTGCIVNNTQTHSEILRARPAQPGYGCSHWSKCSRWSLYFAVESDTWVRIWFQMTIDYDLYFSPFQIGRWKWEDRPESCRISPQKPVNSKEHEQLSKAMSNVQWGNLGGHLTCQKIFHHVAK